MKVAWVTGASRGIGKAVVKEFLSNGWKVVVLTRNTIPLQDLQLQYGEQIHVHPTDVTKLAALELPDFPVDVLLNNAGALVNKPMMEISMEELKYVYDVNVFGPFELIQRLIPQFSSDTHVVNVSSVGGVQGSVKFPGLTAYSSSKGAIITLTECLQAEFSETNWAFNALALGAVQTEMLQDAFPGYQAPLLPEDLSPYIFDFATTAHKVMKGKVVSVSLSTP